MKFNVLSAISAICVAMFAVPAIAQDANQGLVRNQPAAGDNGGAPANVQTETFGDWVYRCTDVKVSDKFTKNCEVLQIRQAKQGDRTANVLIMAIAQVNGEKPGDKPVLMLTTVVPLNVFLLEGILFTVEKQNVMQLPFRYCNQQGCWAQVLLDEKTLATFKKGNEGKARFMVMNGQAADVQFSLKGMTKALERLQASKN
ncbi:invasion associated locus B family protein [Bartonella sp. HY406]|uniref:invasion associated locus B family protein n=1 Tax=Bartonella sp. HY406 TaxID=2979331 RepID=UPI0021C96D72|nr:invasion associated locus B family protein [Bartonella sp. HY406]UXN02382.1 invasion associated locus B family protein [Bartonella sp. HY406]